MKTTWRARYPRTPYIPQILRVCLAEMSWSLQLVVLVAVFRRETRSKSRTVPTAKKYCVRKLWY